MKSIMRNFNDDFEVLCKENLNEVAIILDTGGVENVYTYKQIYEYTGRFLSFFDKLGMKEGDIVLSIIPNSFEAIICFFASIRGGFGYAPLPCNASVRETKRWIEIIKPKLILVKEELDIEFFGEIQKQKIYVEKLKCDGNLEWLPSEEILAKKGDDSKVYLFTSGTTGEAKAMVINSNKLWSSGYAFANHYNLLKSKVRFWNYLPMSYLGGLYNLSLIPLCCSGSFVITEPFSGKTMLSFWNVLEQFNINAIWFVPTIVNGLLKLSSITHSSIRKVNERIKIAFIGTAPIKYETKHKFEETFGIKLFENYALSETTFLTAETCENVRYRSQSSVGEVLPYVDMKFLQNENEEIFEIEVKTPFLFEGYLNDKGEIIRYIDKNGYFKTGDLGKIDSTNQVILLGRDRDIIKKGGLFVSLKEIEVLVEQLDFIEEAAAVRVEHDFYGESYILFVIPAYNTKDIKAECS